MKNKEFEMLAKTFKGLEQVLATELVQLGANNVQVERRAVSFTGDKRMLYTANMCLRTASRVLVPILSFKAQKADDIYEQVNGVFRLFSTFTICHLSRKRCHCGLLDGA